MNATSLDELRAAQAGNSISSATPPATSAPDLTASPKSEPAPVAASPDAAIAASDTRMEQIRQLLLGDQLELNAGRLASLEARQASFETTVLHRLDLISQRLDALSRDVLADRRAAFDELARAVQDLGSRVRGI